MPMPTPPSPSISFSLCEEAACGVLVSVAGEVGWADPRDPFRICRFHGAVSNESKR